MSADIYAKPDVSKKVRYNRNVQEDKEEREEKEVEIYESVDAIGDYHSDNQSHGGGPHTERHPPAVQRRPFRDAALCLAVLCFLMITGIIILSTYYNLVALETDQLQTRYDQLSSNYSQIQRKVSEKWCPDGWKRSGCSCYFKSNETKTWFRSREYCQQRGADLVVINSKEEQKFVTELSKDGESWTGLWDGLRQREWKLRQGDWKWVDGSPLTETFWASGLPQDNRYMIAATCCDQQGKWTQGICDYETKKWICEK
ncbi:CD209 antigen-like protein E isoform X2 [Perca fluviatilis]|uniref:CD209 antigen-like protein E isoform X2 n=1 Tax=Perca fluviatilis TaxID=8168 RepID=UPI0019667D83|nr:CD209 antigen-like protein E isoform X2 [Perca fluviatilis]